MKKSCLVFAATFLFALPSFAREKRVLPREGDRVPNEIVLRFKSARAMGLSARQRRAARGELRHVPKEVRDAHRRFGVRDVRRVLREEGDGARRGRRRGAGRSGGRRANPERAEAYREGLERTVVLTVDSREEMRRVLNTYRALPDVELAEENKIYSVQLVPNDPSFSQLWGLAKIKAPDAWSLSTGTGVVVAVLDTGVDATHPDLAASLWTHPGEIPGNGIDDDGNGYIDDVHGWDCVEEDNLPSDFHGHGSHVAGTIAATGNNGLGVIGLAFNARVMPVKGLSNDGLGTSADLAQALVYAADNGADVINNSWGGIGGDSIIENAVAYAINMGAVVVAAAGNYNVDVDTFYPARFPGVIAVSAFDANDQKASFSNFGSRIDVAAPGVGILSTTQGAYSSMNGTSMAAPHVSGLAALILSVHPEYSATEVREMIRQSADDVSTPGFDAQAGYGRINAWKALQSVPAPPDTTPPLVSIVAPTDGAVLSGSPLVSGTASDNGELAKVEIWVDDIFIGNAVGGANWTYRLDTSPLSLGDHTLTARAWDAAGNVGTASLSFRVENTGNALYSAALKTPVCDQPGSSCDSGVLLLGRARMVNGIEPNNPNTLGGSCSDGSAGSFHADESNDRLRVSSVDGSPLAAGSLARVDATVWAYSGTSNFLDLFYAENALSPAWKLMATIPAKAAGPQVLSATYTLPEGEQQAVRAQFRYGGAPSSPCLAGSYNDHDDLVFAVKGTEDLTPPTVTLLSPKDGEILQGTVGLDALATDNIGVVRFQWRLGGENFGPVISTPPYGAAWDTALGPDGHVRVEAEAQDAAGNQGTASRLVVVNNLVPLFVSLPPPVVTITDASFVWTLNEPFALLTVDYGTSLTYGEIVQSTQPESVNGAVTLNGLKPRTTYHAKITVEDTAGQRVATNDIVFTTMGDTLPPLVTFTTPSEGAVLSESVALTGTAEDNVDLSHVTLYIDGRKWKTLAGVGPAVSVAGEREPAPVEVAGILSNSTNWDFLLDTTQLDNGSHVLRVEAQDSSGNKTSITRGIGTSNGAAIASFDPLRGAPTCGQVGVACASGGSLEGRDTIRGGFPEPNQPNTRLVSPCPDGSIGTYHSDESLDWLRVTSLDGSPFAPGKTVRLDARVWAYSGTSNHLDLYYAAHGSSSSWTSLGTYSPSGSRMRVISTTFTLTEGGAHQGVRGVFRYNGAASPGACVVGGYNDHDDLLFAVQQVPLPPTVAFSKPGPRSISLSWTPSPEGPSASGFRLDVSTTPTFTVFNPGFSDLDLSGLSTDLELLSLQPFTTYYARVRSYNGAGVSPSSEPAIGRTLGLPDLLVSSLSVSPVVMKPGDSFSLVLTLLNVGQGPSVPQLNFQAFMDDSASPSWGAFSSSLEPGETFSWTFHGTAGTEGNHTVRVVADALNKQEERDEANNARSVSFQVDGSPPSVSLTSPLSGSSVTGMVPVTAEAVDAVSGVNHVVFSVNGVDISTVTVPPYSALWDARSLAGDHLISVRAIDNVGHVSSGSVTVSAFSPLNAQRVAATKVPPSLIQRQRMTLVVTLKNTGTNAWSAADGIQLGSLFPPDNTLWGPSRVPLRATDLIPSGSSKSFFIEISAPSVPGVYPLRWQMMKAGVPVEYFGDMAFDDSLAVVEDTVPPSVPTGVIFSAADTSALTLSWSPSVDAAGVAEYRVDVGLDADFTSMVPAYQDLSVGLSRSRRLTALTPGTTYWARVRAIDVNGLVSDSGSGEPGVTLLTPDQTPPTVSISYPTAGQVIPGTITVEAVAADNVGVASVWFYVDEVAKALDSVAPFTFTWNPSTYADGPHTLKALASDHAANRRSATVPIVLSYDRVVPSVPGDPRLGTPTATNLVLTWQASTDNRAVVGYRTDVSVNADFNPLLPLYNNRSIGNVLSHTVTGLGLGTTYYARVRAVDANGNVSENSATAVGATLSSFDQTPPAVSLTSPAPNATVSGVVLVKANASDNVSVSRVVFFIDWGTPFTDAEAPYLHVWDTAQVEPGSHSLQAVAYDTTGNATSAYAVPVTVVRGGVGSLSVVPDAVEDEPLAFGKVFLYPHPVPNGGSTFHLEVGSADRVTVRVQNLAGETVFEGESTQSVPGNGGRRMFKIHWDPRGRPSGTYVWTVEAEKMGIKIRAQKKLIVVH
jgi:subtilisin family serine protease